MRVWKGKEREIAIFQNIEMLFIQGETVDIQKVLEIAKEHNISTLYFGAGKTEFNDFEKLKLLPLKGYGIIIETTILEKIPTKQQELIMVYRVELEKIQRRTIVKLEKKNTISTISNNQIFSIEKTQLNPETLIYESDELLWDDEK